jgi:hypothetical protein
MVVVPFGLWLTMLENFYSEATNGFNHQLNLQLKMGHRPKPTGVFNLTHIGVNCKARTIAYLSGTDYDANGTALKSFTEPDFKKVKRSTLTPETVAEAEVEAVCRIYPKSGSYPVA